MDYYGSQISRLIEQLSALPGIGSKTAQRLAFHIVNMPMEKVQALSESVLDAKKNVRYCKQCFTMTDRELCPICSNPKRNRGQIMVVENTRDLAAYEKTGRFERYPLKGADDKTSGRGARGYHRHKLKPGGRDDGYVYQQAYQTYRNPGDQDSQRRSGRR